MYLFNESNSCYQGFFETFVEKLSFASQVILSLVQTLSLWHFMSFFLNDKIFYLHMSIGIVEVPVLLRVLELQFQMRRYFNYPKNNIAFATGFGHKTMNILLFISHGIQVEQIPWKETIQSYNQKHFQWWYWKLWVTILDYVQYMGRLPNKLHRDFQENYSSFPLFLPIYPPPPPSICILENLSLP